MEKVQIHIHAKGANYVATDSETGPDSVEPLGQLTVVMDDGLRISLRTSGVMCDPAFIELALGYVRQYANNEWRKSFQKERDGSGNAEG